jgi:hypothetical protein
MIVAEGSNSVRVVMVLPPFQEFIVGGLTTLFKMLREWAERL